MGNMMVVPSECGRITGGTARSMKCHVLVCSKTVLDVASRTAIKYPHANESKLVSKQHFSAVFVTALL